MGLKCLSNVICDEERPLTPAQFAVMVAIAYNADDDGWAFPSISTISQRARVSVRHVKRIVKELEESGFVTVLPEQGWNGTNLYGINAMCKGVFCPPSPDEIRDRIYKRNKPSKKRLSPHDTMSPMTPCHGDKRMSKMSPESVLNHVERENGFPEVPPMSRKDFDALVDMRGVPKDCAEWFWNTNDARNWLDRTGQPIRKVEPLLLNAVAAWRSKPANLDGQTGGRFQKKIGGVWQATQRLEALKNRAKNHEANELSSAYSSEPTEAQFLDYEKLCADIRECERELEGATA